jgi:hypothetical protein
MYEHAGTPRCGSDSHACAILGHGYNLDDNDRHDSKGDHDGRFTREHLTGSQRGGIGYRDDFGVRTEWLDAVS